MDLSCALTEQLSDLTLTLDDPGTDLHDVLTVLTNDLAAAIPSYLGLTMSWRHDDGLVTLTDLDAELIQMAGTSIELPLVAMAGGPGATVVCYARKPGCFDALAADSGRVCSSGHGIVDGQALSGSIPIRPVGISGLGELTVINRAIGVLITRGESPADAHAELVSRAALRGQSLPKVAHQVLSSTNTRAPY